MTARIAGRIGPNAILQLAPVLENAFGRGGLSAILAEAGIAALPDGTRMIPEEEAARLHESVRRRAPARAPALLREAGERTADYILAHRIPRAAQTLLKALPTPLAARVLSRAIAGHAWTFAGSGQFRAVTPWEFALSRNPLIAGARSEVPLCVWHAAVFERLYRALVGRDIKCVETACVAHGAACCVFRLTRG